MPAMLQLKCPPPHPPEACLAVDELEEAEVRKAVSPSWEELDELKAAVLLASRSSGLNRSCTIGSYTVITSIGPATWKLSSV
jgi:hypothetical protein